MMDYDFLVVGSGCTGMQAAQTLVEAGTKVGLLDVGETNERYAGVVPTGTNDGFLEIRKGDAGQHRYFLGDRFEGIPTGPAGAGAQLTPPRQYVTRDAGKFAPFSAEGEFEPVQSFARGGLGAAWGLGSHVFSDVELLCCGLEAAEISRIQEAYETVSRRVGISGARDDIARFSLGGLRSLQKALPIDDNAQTLLEAYGRRRDTLNRDGFFLGQCPLALLSEGRCEDEDGGERRARSSLQDMDFWTDEGRSAYRPWITLDALEKKSGFHSLSRRLVTRFEEIPDGVRVSAFRVESGETESFTCRRLVMGAGALGTARIVLRSLGRERTRLPLICNPFTYLASLNLKMLGRPGSSRRHSLAQLVLFYAPKPEALDDVMVSLFSYRSLLLFRLLKDFPFNYAQGREVMQFLQSALVLATINHADFPSEEKFLERISSQDSITGDSMKGHYRLSEREARAMDEKNRRIQRAFWRLGCVPLKRIDLNPGASIHYGGTLPFSSREKEFHTAADGRLWGTQRVFIADGSSFRYLPAKGPTLTFMANAHRVATHALRQE